MTRTTSWSPTHPPSVRAAVGQARALARLPAFTTCTPRELRRIASWGDLVEVEAGHVVVREDHSDWWFFVVVSGGVRLTRRGRVVGDAGVGAHVGERAVLGLRPQPETATATQTSVLFVLGPRYVLTLLSRSRSFRHAVFPDVPASDFRAFARRMHTLGETEWRRLASTTAATSILQATGTRATELRAAADQPPGRGLTLAEAGRALAHLPDPPPVDRPAVVVRMGPRGWLAAAAVVTAAACGVLFGYHPPRLVVSAGRPIDVLGDIRITGAVVYHPSGRYDLLWVKVRQPTLAGLLLAWARGRPTVAVPADEAAQTRTGRTEYLASQSGAIRLAVAAAGVDARRVSVHIRDRGFAGPSAGLVYALAVEDLLTPGDLTRGRTIAVTGGVLPDGAVEPIGWLDVKVHGADDDHASLLLVPEPQLSQAAGNGAATCGAATFRDALADLAGRGARCSR